MVIRAHRKLSVNLKLFLETVGYECYFNTSEKDYDELLVVAELSDEFLQNVEDYVGRWGFIPYHFSLAPTKKGKKKKDEKAIFTGNIKETKAFKALQGDFSLVLFEDKSNAYLWKTYTDSPPQSGKYEVNSKVKAVIDGYHGENLKLISHCRLKEVE